jgi:uncharacterized protein (DUF433 family)
MGSENLTPERYRCPMGDCPSVHRLNDGRLLIVGQYNPARARMVGASMGEDETAIVIDPGLLEEFLRRQAGYTAIVEDGVAASAALHPGDGDETLDRGLPRQLTIHLCARDGLLHAFSDDVPDFYISGTDVDAVLSDIAPVLTKILADNYGKTVQEYCQRMKGLLGSLTEEQRAAAFAYDGPEFLGGDHQSQIEEPALAGDEVEITADPSVCGGRPVFAGTRFPVFQIVELMASGCDPIAIEFDYPEISDAHIRAAMRYVLEIMDDRERGQSPKGGDFAEGSVHADPVPEGNSPNQDFEAKARELFDQDGCVSVYDVASALLTASKDATERLEEQFEELRHVAESLYCIVDAEMRALKSAQDAGHAGLKDTEEVTIKKRAIADYLAIASAIRTQESS